MGVPQYRWAGWLVGFFVVIGAGVYLWFSEGRDLKEQLGGYSLSETLPEAVDADGKDARVVSLLDDGGDVSIEVLTGDGRVQERFFGRVCTDSAQQGGSCSYQKTNRDHPASRAERARARVTLDQIDPEVTDRLRKDAGVADSTRVGLRGNRWVISAGAKPQIARLDGSGLHQARSRAERALVQSVSSDSGAR